MHALRPIVPGKEALIAGFFGLIHGLAFAAKLDRLGLARLERVIGILAFNFIRTKASLAGSSDMETRRMIALSPIRQK
jgi:HupE / UreJ protein